MQMVSLHFGLLKQGILSGKKTAGTPLNCAFSVKTTIRSKSCRCFPLSLSKDPQKIPANKSQVLHSKQNIILKKQYKLDFLWA